MSGVPPKTPYAESRGSADQETKPLRTNIKETDARQKNHLFALFLLFVYIPLTTVPWALTCVMSKHPLGTTSYHVPGGLAGEQIRGIERWVTAIRVLNSISSVVTIPTLSALLAQAAVVYSESREPRHDFQVKHLTVLADRVWTNPVALAELWKWEGQESVRVRNLIYFAAGMILLGGLQQPLYQVLVPIEPMLVLNHDARFPQNVGWEPDPEGISKTFLDPVVQRLIREMAIANVEEAKANWWANMSAPEVADQKLPDLYSENFVSALPQGTTTGVLRELVLRFNSSVSCERIPRSQFPSPCTGERSFNTSFTHDGNSTRVCVPGDLMMSPWTLSRSRQDIGEDLYLDVVAQLEMVIDGFLEDYPIDFTLHCSATTTRGYFEPGNYFNNYTWGPLLERWPSSEELKAYNGYPRTESTDSPRQTHFSTLMYTPGPLATAAIALFGRNTFFDLGIQAWNDTSTNKTHPFSWDQVCATLPFSQYESPLPLNTTDQFPPCAFDAMRSSVDQGTSWSSALAIWLHGFNDTAGATEVLGIAVALATEAFLTPETYNKMGTSRATGRFIYSGTGTTIHKPRVSVVAMAVISSIIALELVGLGLLGWIIFRSSSTVRALDAMTFASAKERIEGR